MGPGRITSWCSTMADLPRMNEEQSRRAKQLIRRLCANHDGGCCLLLDNGDPCVCPQSITNALVCRYFKAAVLPADVELCGAVMGARPSKRCRVCGAPIAVSCNAVKYCPRCARQERRKQDVERKRKRALGFRK